MLVVYDAAATITAPTVSSTTPTDTTDDTTDTDQRLKRKFADFVFQNSDKRKELEELIQDQAQELRHLRQERDSLVLKSEHASKQLALLVDGREQLYHKTERQANELQELRRDCDLRDKKAVEHQRQEQIRFQALLQKSDKQTAEIQKLYQDRVMLVQEKDKQNKTPKHLDNYQSELDMKQRKLTYYDNQIMSKTQQLNIIELEWRKKLAQLEQTRQAILAFMQT